LNQDYYIKQYYSGDKVPKGMLVVNTTNAESFKSWWGEFIQKVRKNPHAINPLVHQSANGNDPVKWIDFMRNLKEMEYTDVRNEIRTQIGALYNVSPIFQNDVSTGGGLNNEGLQITVTDRGVEMGQSIYNDKIIPWMVEQLGISDYDWKLNPSKEQDQIAEKDLRLKEIQIARETAALGLEVTMNETGEFSYKPGKVTPQTNSPSLSDFEGLTKSCKSIQLEPEEEQDDSEELEKSEQPTKAQIKEIESALSNELEKLLSKFDTKRKPSKEELEKKVNEIVKDFDKVVKTKSSAKLKAIYKKAMESLGKDLKRDFTMTEVDKNVIEALKREPVYNEAFANISNTLSDRLKKTITEAYSKPEGFSINQLVKEMKENTDAIDSDLRRIARTESGKISMASRKVQYDKTGENYKYYHIGPDDNRTTKASGEIKVLTKNGVSWDEYVNIVSKVSKKYFPEWIVNPMAPLSHYNSRHTFIAKRA
jgi:hypothetical protein